MRRAQLWSLDFTLSLLMFLVASTVAYTIIANIESTGRYGEIAGQAAGAIQILTSDGYPVHWDNSTVIRAGLLSDGQLSIRKARLVPIVENAYLRKGLRLTDTAYVYVTNSTGDVVPITGECGFGDISTPSTAGNASLKAIALAGAIPSFSDDLNITAYSNASGIADMQQHDVIIVDGNISAVLGMTGQQIGNAFANIARRGVTISFSGDPGADVLGMRLDSVATANLTVQRDFLGFTQGSGIALTDPDVRYIVGVSGDDVTEYEVLATASGGEHAAARWRYLDAQVYYFPSTDGAYAGVDLADFLANATRELFIVAWPQCPAPTIPDTANIAHHEGILAYHDDLLTVHAIVWGSG